MEDSKIYEVNGKKLTEEELMELKKNPKIKLTEIAPNIYKKLERIYG